MTDATKQEQLDALNKEWEMKDLPLKEAATQAVPGEGSPKADILFIGEAPGAKEDELGRPFVGAAGKFLDELIAGIGLKREDVFIANVIKHRPPNNRDPLPTEIEAYAPWLEAQIDIINPKLIATLGRFSMAFMLGEGLSITKEHGQPKRIKVGVPPSKTGRASPGFAGRVVMPMYHPAAALYRGDLRPVLAADFAKIAKVLELVEKGGGVTQEEQVEAEAEPEAAEEQKSLL